MSILIEKKLKINDLPEDIQALEQIYQIEKLEQCVHIDTSINIKNQNEFTKLNIFFGHLFFKFNDEILKIDTIFCYIEAINSVFPFPTDITLGKFIYNKNLQIEKLGAMDNEMHKFLLTNNISNNDLIKKLKQQFLTVHLK